MHRALTPSDQGSAAGDGSVTGGAAAQPDAECFFILSIGYIYIMIHDQWMFETNFYDIY